jgi:hypothetical protein
MPRNAILPALITNPSSTIDSVAANRRRTARGSSDELMDAAEAIGGVGIQPKRIQGVRTRMGKKGSRGVGISSAG